MRQIIQHENGECITADEWKEIRQSALTIKHTRLDVLSIRHLPPAAARVTRKKNFYRRYFIKEWSQALRELELLAPLLTLCCGVWKADKTLGCILDGKPVPQAVSRPPSRASSVSSSLSHATSLSRAPSRTSAPGVPPSSSLGSSSRPPSSAASHSRPSQQSPHRVALGRSSGRSRPISEPAEPASVTKSAASKGKRRREPSPLPTEKRAKAGGDNASDLGT